MALQAVVIFREKPRVDSLLWTCVVLKPGVNLTVWYLDIRTVPQFLKDTFCWSEPDSTERFFYLALTGFFLWL